MVNRDDATPPDGWLAPEVGAAIPGADAIEAARVVPDRSGLVSTIDDEVPEADALDQAAEVPLDDAYDR